MMDRELMYNDELTAPRWALNSAVECHLHTVEVIGSNPIAPTILSMSHGSMSHERWLWAHGIAPSGLRLRPRRTRKSRNERRGKSAAECAFPTSRFPPNRRSATEACPPFRLYRYSDRGM